MNREPTELNHPMIQLSRNYSLPEKAEEDIPIKVVGVGGAGSNVLDRIVLDGSNKADLIAINTDVQSLASSVAAHKVQLGRTVTRGLGAGGDPELGYNAAYESADEIRQALTDARMIFVCTGLGGGTGSGAAPAVAQVAREGGLARDGFRDAALRLRGKTPHGPGPGSAGEDCARIADAVICFENDRMGDMVAPKAGIHQAFAVADVTISQSVRSIVSLIQRPGLIRIGFDDLLSALRSPSGRCLFGFGESDSDNRAHDALTQALKNPLMDRGRMLADASHVLVQVAGGPGDDAFRSRNPDAGTRPAYQRSHPDSFRHVGRWTDGKSVERDADQFACEREEEVTAPAASATKPANSRSSRSRHRARTEPVAPPAPPIWEQPAKSRRPWPRSPSPFSKTQRSLLNESEPRSLLPSRPEPAPVADVPEEPVDRRNAAASHA